MASRVSALVQQTVHEEEPAQSAFPSSGSDATVPQDVRGKSSALPAPGTREPAIMVIEFAYLSELPAPGFLQQLGDKPGYLLDVHVGMAARADPPSKPGPRAIAAVQPQVPGGYNPEEEILHAQVQQRVKELLTANGVDEKTQQVPKLECRYHIRVPVRLSDCGPGPGKGGPPYFRVDVWTEARLPLQRQPQRNLFGRVFVPINDPQLQRRFCTWPVVDNAGKEVAYLTCDYSFGHVPVQVEGLKVDEVTSTKAVLSWKPPRWSDERLPILGYRVEAKALHRRQSFESGSSLPAAWELVANVEMRGPLRATAASLRGDTRYSFRVFAVNEAGAGEPAEVDATTSPTAPSVCGPPRLGVCTGSVLTVEWEPPKDDGGMPIVSYWVMIRPSDANAGPADWSDVGAVKPKEGRVQRADIHCDRLNASVAEYVCSVAAENAAGQYGPPTPDAALLRLPNPCGSQGVAGAAAPPPVPSPPPPPGAPDWSQMLAVKVEGEPDPGRFDLHGPPNAYGFQQPGPVGAAGAPPGGFHGPPPPFPGGCGPGAPPQAGRNPGWGPVSHEGGHQPCACPRDPLPHEVAMMQQGATQPWYDPHHAHLQGFIPHHNDEMYNAGYGPQVPRMDYMDPIDGPTVHRLIDLTGKVAYGREAASPGVSEKPSFVAAGLLGAPPLADHDLYGAGFVPHHGSCLNAEVGQPVQRLIDLADRVAGGMDLGPPAACSMQAPRGDLYSTGYEPDHGQFLDAEARSPALASPPGGRPLTPSVEESRAQLQQQLEEKRRLLQSSLVRCKQVSSEISQAPSDAKLHASLESAEIEAAAYQAEVAVICQRLKDLGEEA